MKITIITVCYNSEKTIEKTILSVLSQNIDNFEYIIVDGLSKDNTMNIINKYKNKNIISISEKDNGIYDAMNKGIKLATGDIIGILNSDDVYAYNNVLFDVKRMFENDNIECCYGNIIYIKNNKPYRYWRSGNPRTFKYGWMPPHPAFFVKRSVYEKYGLFRLDCGVNADYELMLRFMEFHKIRAKWVNKTFVLMQAGGRSNDGIKTRLKSVNNDKYAWYINGHKPYFYTIIFKKIRKIPQYIFARFFLGNSYL